jgi:hypothetical protein
VRGTRPENKYLQGVWLLTELQQRVPKLTVDVSKRGAFSRQVSLKVGAAKHNLQMQPRSLQIHPFCQCVTHKLELCLCCVDVCSDGFTMPARPQLQIQS